MNGLSGKTCIIFGDSIMFGSGNDGFGIGEYLEKDYHLSIKKYCIGGARTGYFEGKSWIVQQVRDAINNGEQADYIVFDGFTNDCCKTDGVNYDVPLGEISEGFEGFDIFAVQKENTTFSNCFENILDAFKKHFPDAKVLFVRPHNMGRRGEEIQKVYGERAVAICEKWGVAVADVYKDSDLNTFLADHRDTYTADTYNWGRGDSTHPNARGYEEKYMPVIKMALEEL
ncbi:MAG: SGNH/GDSL hydrolase family protein [Clostridia bacterium]|nr:SGNH/GDSL hydrolase family protein [Clostridia bacterium]